MKYSYYAKRVVQWDGAPPFYLLALRPSELLSWASVPAKAPRAMDGYQRPLTNRYERIAAFMQAHKSNIIPGTIVVASEFGAPEIAISPAALVDENGTAIDADHGIVRIEFSYDPPAHQERLKEIIQRLEDRDWNDEELAAREEATEGGQDGIADTQTEVAAPVDGDADVALTSRMGEFLRTLQLLHKDWDSLDEKERSDWTAWIEDNHKIGFIMDGQHRVWGADNVNPDECEHLADDAEPVLSVTFIPELSRAEQVFHFAMMNITPEKVKAGQARGNAAFSLTAKEFDEYIPRAACRHHRRTMDRFD